jgi:hypothetical protein
MTRYRSISHNLTKYALMMTGLVLGNILPFGVQLVLSEPFDCKELYHF